MKILGMESYRVRFVAEQNFENIGLDDDGDTYGDVELSVNVGDEYTVTEEGETQVKLESDSEYIIMKKSLFDELCEAIYEE